MSSGFNTVAKACFSYILKEPSPVNGSVKKSGLKYDPFKFGAKMSENQDFGLCKN